MSGERGKEMQERGWGGFCWEGALLQGMGSVLQLIPTSLQGCGLITALVAQQGGRRCLVLWQWLLGRSAGSCPVLVFSLSPWPCQYQNLTVWGQGKLCLPVLCSPLARTRDGLWEPGDPITAGSLGGFSTEGAGGQAWSTLINILDAKCPWLWIFGCYLEFCAGKQPTPPNCCAPSRARWELLIYQGGVRGAEAGWQSYPQHRDVSQAVFSGCAA